MNALHLSVAKTRKNMPKSSIKKVCGFKVRRCGLEGLLKVSLGDSKWLEHWKICRIFGYFRFGAGKLTWTKKKNQCNVSGVYICYLLLQNKSPNTRWLFHRFCGSAKPGHGFSVQSFHNATIKCWGLIWRLNRGKEGSASKLLNGCWQDSVPFRLLDWGLQFQTLC